MDAAEARQRDSAAVKETMRRKDWLKLIAYGAVLALSIAVIVNSFR